MRWSWDVARLVFGVVLATVILVAYVWLLPYTTLRQAAIVVAAMWTAMAAGAWLVERLADEMERRGNAPAPPVNRPYHVLHMVVAGDQRAGQADWAPHRIFFREEGNRLKVACGVVPGHSAIICAKHFLVLSSASCLVEQLEVPDPNGFHYRVLLEPGAVERLADEIKQKDDR